MAVAAARGIVWARPANLVASGFLHLFRRKQSPEGWDGAFPPALGTSLTPWVGRSFWPVLIV